MPRAIILGAGSIGCFNGLSWLANGLDVSFLGRETTGAELTANGGTISGPFASLHVDAGKISYSTTPEHLAGTDIIFLAVKVTGNEIAARDIRQYAKPGTLIVSLQNGIGNAERLRVRLPDFEIVEGMTPFNVVKTAPAHWRKTTKGELILQSHERLRAFFQPLENTPFAVHFHEDMRAVLWSKLLLNLNNALNALSGETLHSQLSNRAWRHLLAAAQDETLAVAKAQGFTLAKLTPLPPARLPGFIRLPNWFFNTIGLKMQGIDRDARSSMSDDFANSRKTEIDYLNGAVVEAGKRLGIPCPVNTAIVKVVKEAETGGQKVWKPAEIEKMIWG